MSSQEQPRQIARTLRPFGESVFTEINRLAIKARAINLSQGCPDFDAPEFIREAARTAIDSGHNQYGPMGGAEDLAAAIVEDARGFMNMEIDPVSEDRHCDARKPSPRPSSGYSMKATRSC